VDNSVLRPVSYLTSTSRLETRYTSVLFAMAAHTHLKLPMLRKNFSKLVKIDSSTLRPEIRLFLNSMKL
jgi:hypothetical protein